MDPRGEVEGDRGPAGLTTERFTPKVRTRTRVRPLFNPRGSCAAPRHGYAVDAFGDAEHVTLRRWLLSHQERVVPVPPAVMRTLARFRSERPDDSDVFVPDWKLDQLWTRIVSHSPVTTDHLCLGIAGCFGMVQRRARLVLARSLACPLTEVEWRDRPVGSLRVTAAVRLAATLDARELAARLGCTGPASVACFVRDAAPNATRGAA